MMIREKIWRSRSAFSYMRRYLVRYTNLCWGINYFAQIEHSRKYLLMSEITQVLSLPPPTPGNFIMAKPLGSIYTEIKWRINSLLYSNKVNIFSREIKDLKRKKNWNENMWTSSGCLMLSSIKCFILPISEIWRGFLLVLSVKIIYCSQSASKPAKIHFNHPVYYL